MLPFMKPEKSTSVIVGHAKPSGGVKMDGEEGEPNHAAIAIAQDFIRAVHSKDANAVATCLEHAFAVMGNKDDDQEGGMSDMFGGDE